MPKRLILSLVLAASLLAGADIANAQTALVRLVKKIQPAVGNRDRL